MSTPGIGRRLRSPWVRRRAAQRGDVSQFLRISAMGRNKEHIRVSMSQWWFGGTTFFVTIEGTLSFSGNLNRQMGKTGLVGALSFDGILAKQIDKSLSGTLTFAGTFLTALIARRDVSGSVSFIGNLVTTHIPGAGSTLRNLWKWWSGGM